VSRGTASDPRLNRLQLLAVILPLAYISALVLAIAAFELPFWAEVVVATAISIPFVLAFSFIIFNLVGKMRDEMMRRERRFRGLLESAPDAIIIVDQKGRIVMVNEQAGHVFGYAAGELLGNSVESLLPDRMRPAHAAHRSDYYQSPSTRPMGIGLDLVARRKDGTIFPAEISLSPIEADEGPLVISVIRDITERRRANEERERLLAEAEAERERQRIGMDLHDGIIQSIYAVGLNLEAAADDINENPADVRGRIDRAIDQLNDTIRDIRSYIFELRPTRFSGDLADSLSGLAHEFRVNSLIETVVDVPPDLPPLSDEGGSAIFHIAQEALNNIRKHARATSVEVRLCRQNGAVSLTIADNGDGFDPSFEYSEEHRGLRNMVSRARGAGGTLNVESVPRKGTRIQVDIPLQVEAGEAG
jgi:PAS domain S-box-containing protein